MSYRIFITLITPIIPIILIYSSHSASSVALLSAPRPHRWPLYSSPSLAYSSTAASKRAMVSGIDTNDLPPAALW